MAKTTTILMTILMIGSIGLMACEEGGGGSADDQAGEDKETSAFDDATGDETLTEKPTIDEAVSMTDLQDSADEAGNLVNTLAEAVNVTAGGSEATAASGSSPASGGNASGSGVPAQPANPAIPAGGGEQPPGAGNPPIPVIPATPAAKIGACTNKDDLGNIEHAGKDGVNGANRIYNFLMVPEVAKACVNSTQSCLQDYAESTENIKLSANCSECFGRYGRETYQPCAAVFCTQGDSQKKCIEDSKGRMQACHNAKLPLVKHNLSVHIQSIMDDFDKCTGDIHFVH
jgi:hypothetical protein